MATIGGHQYSGGFSSGPMGQGGFPGQGGGGFGAFGSPGGPYYVDPTKVAPKPQQPKPAAPTNAMALTPLTMLASQLNIPGGSPYGVTLPSYGYFGQPPAQTRPMFGSQTMFQPMPPMQPAVQPTQTAGRPQPVRDPRRSMIMGGI